MRLDSILFTTLINFVNIIRTGYCQSMLLFNRTNSALGPLNVSKKCQQKRDHKTESLKPYLLKGPNQLLLKKPTLLKTRNIECCSFGRRGIRTLGKTILHRCSKSVPSTTRTSLLQHKVFDYPPCFILKDSH